MSNQRVFITEGFPDDFPDEVEKRFGVRATSLDDCEPDDVGDYNSLIAEKRVSQCEYVIISLTKSMEETCHVAMFESLVKTHDEKKCGIIPIKFVADAVVPGVLVCFRTLDYSNGSQAFWSQLEKRLKAQVSLSKLLPVGNVAPGLVWNYFYGYLMNVLKKYTKEYMECLERKAYGANVQGHGKLILLLPQHCTCKSLLDEYDKNIRYLANEAMSERTDRAGHAKVMRQSVYEIQDRGETFVLLVDVPNIITTISKLASREDISFTSTDVQKQYKLFRSSLKEALDYEKEWENLYLIVEFDENDPNLKLGEILSNEVRKDREKTMSQMEIECGEYEYDVNVVADGEEIDQRLETVVQGLRRDGVRVFVIQEEVAGNLVQDAMTAIHKARKTLLWIDGEMKESQCFSFFEAQMVQVQRQRDLFIPVVKGDPASLPISQTTNIKHLQHINHLYTTEPDFECKLRNAITGDTPLTYPLGDIATGLVWTYSMNYLEQNLDSYVENYVQQLSYDKESVLYPKFILLIPETCHAPGKITEYDPTIQRMTDEYKEEVTVEKTVGGSKRIYNIAINKLSYNNGTGTQVYKVMCEFVTPLAALANMEKGMKTQLSTAHKLKQREIFDDLFQRVVESGRRKGTGLRHCTVIKFKDEFADQTNRKGPKFNLSKLIAEHIENDRTQ